MKMSVMMLTADVTGEGQLSIEALRGEGGKGLVHTVEECRRVDGAGAFCGALEVPELGDGLALGEDNDDADEEEEDVEADGPDDDLPEPLVDGCEGGELGLLAEGIEGGLAYQSACT